MRRLVLLVAVASLSLGVVAPYGATSVSAKQLTARFKQATGQKLVPNKQISYAGHYAAYDLGISTAAKRALYGNFTVYLITGSDVDADVERLLADTHTGELATPTAAGIYWEQGVTLQGATYWQAKRRYGSNVVVKWIGSSPVKKTDATWKRLHTALTKSTK